MKYQANIETVNREYHTEVISMGIEPLGSVMSYQPQMAQPIAQKVTAVEAPAAEFTDGAAQAETQQIPEQGNIVITPAQNGTQNAQQQNEQIRKAVEQINKKMENSSAVFGYHEATNRITIKIVDKETKEVIKEFPPEKTLDMIAKAWELAGILVDEKR